MGLPACPDRETLAALAAGNLPDAILDALEAHVKSCSRCVAILDDMDPGNDPLLSAFRRPSVPDRFHQEPECGRAVTRFVEESTQEYRSPAGSPEGTAEAVRAGLAAEQVKSEAEVREALRQRLRAVALLLVVGIAIARGIGLGFAYPRLLADPLSAFTQPPCYGNAFLVLCLEVLAVVLLAPKHRLSLPHLRGLAWLVFAPPALAVAWDGTLDLAALAPTLNEQSGLTVAYAKSLPWVLFMVGYGVLVPNTWQRCAAVVGVFALLALLPDLAVLVGNETTAGTLLVYLANKLFWLSLAAVIVVYGAWLWKAQSEEAAASLRLGHYLLKRRLDRGGMGEVYLAEHVLLRRQSAVKVIRPEHAGEAKALRRLEREAREMALLTHPNIVQVYDYGFTGATFYYVMEYLPGLTLEELVQVNGGPLSPARAVYLLRQLCGALQDVHRRGLTHRDIKPRNIMVCERGGKYDVAKLLDFGLVQITSDQNGGLANAELAGTPAYMAPEQWEKQRLDGRTDLYALGGVAYFLLTGRRPFEGQSVAQMRGAHLHDPPEDVTKIRPDVPAELAEIVHRCLAKVPAERFPNVEALEAALAACRFSEPWGPEEAARWWSPWPSAPSAVEGGGGA